MTVETQFVFSPFTLDVANQRLSHGRKEIFLRAKSLAVLTYLVEHPHRLVAKAELMKAVWGGAKVVEATLRVSIAEIRKALGDDPAKPKFIQTAGKDGYRFLAAVGLKFTEEQHAGLANSFVGRAAELEQLRHHLELARGGKRQAVFITGEPGIGKTTLIDVFTSQFTENGAASVARGQCIEQYGAGEAFLPVLDALEQLCRDQDGQTIIDSLRQFAPSWLLDLPTLISPQEREALARQCLGVVPERRLREIAAFFEAIAKNRAIVLILEDLQWVDPSTLALISYLPRRREAARLMVIGTCRGGEVERFNLPLKTVAEGLTLHHRAVHLPLKLLSRNSVEDYLAARFDRLAVSSPVVSTVYSRSEGNPLFMVAMTDYLGDREAIVRENDTIKLAANSEREPVPGTIRGLITRQFEALPDEDRELLETASVAGMTFSVLLVARLLGREREAVEQRCRELAEREQFLQYSGSRKRPSGTSSALYGFTHALYHNVIYDRAVEAKRRRLHHSMGTLLEEVFQEATEQVAAELARHFERAGNSPRAVRYLLQAAQKSRQNSAYQEAIYHAEAGLRLAKSLPDTAVMRELELQLKINLGASIAATKGYAASEAREIFTRAGVLSGKVGDISLAISALMGLWSSYLMRGELRAALTEGQKILALAQGSGNATSLASGHLVVGMALFYQGDFSAAHDHFAKSFSDYQRDRSPRDSGIRWWETDVLGSSYRVKTFWLLGFPEQERKEAQKALSLARELAIPLHIAQANASLANHYAACGEVENALELADVAIKVSTEHGFDHWTASGMIVKGWALCKRGELTEGLTMAQQGLAMWHRTGAATVTPKFLAFLAQCFEAANNIEKSLELVNEGLSVSETTDDRFYAAELYRLKGQLLLSAGKNKVRAEVQKEAERCFLQACEIANRQKAKSLLLRTALNLHGLWRYTGKQNQARALLRKTYESFTEGFDTPELKEAKRLLGELS